MTMLTLIVRETDGYLHGQVEVDSTDRDLLIAAIQRAAENPNLDKIILKRNV